MPTVRTYGTQKVDPTALPGVRRTAAETPTSTGVGLSEAQAGTARTIAGFGSEIANIGVNLYARHEAENRRLALEEKRRADETAVLAAENTIAEWENKRLYDPQNGALAIKGKDAMPLPESVGAEFEQVAGDTAGSLTTPEQRAAFARIRANRALNLDVTLRRHVYGEMQHYEAGELKAFVDNASATAIANANDPRRVGEELNKITVAIEKHAPRAGLGPEQVQETVAAAKTGVHAGVIDRLLATNQDRAARVYFDATKEQISGEAVARIERALEEGSTRGASQRQADAIVRAGGTLTEQLEKVRAIDDPKVRDAVRERVEHDYSVNEKITRDREEQESVQAFNLVDKAKDIRAIPPGMWSRFSGSTKAALRAYAKHLAEGDPVETDPTTYYALLQQASGAPGFGTATDFVNQNLLNYKHKLSDSDFKSLAGMQASIRNNDRKAVDKDLAAFRTKRDILENTLTQYGIDPKKNADEVAQLQRMLDVRLEAAQAGGVKVTNTEIQSTLDDLLSQSEKVPGSWWHVLPFTGPFFDQEKKLLDLKVGDISAGDRAQIEDALRRAGQPISDATVLNLYLEHKVRTRGR